MENQPATWKNILGMEFVLIPAGEFLMGSTSAEIDALVHSWGQHIRRDFGQRIRQNAEHEMPQHRVRISQPFYLGKYEVTQNQWEVVMGSNPSHFKGDPNRPVEQVSWDDVQEFIQKLNAKETGTKYRFPTEAEWEYAARAGSTTAYSFGNDESRLGEYAWYRKNSSDTTHPVRQLKPNAWGLYDMHGNVWEWCYDSQRPYADYTVDDPVGPTVAGDLRVIRGGGWADPAQHVRAAFRYWFVPGFRVAGVGFRCLSSGMSRAAPETR